MQPTVKEPTVCRALASQCGMKPVTPSPDKGTIGNQTDTQVDLSLQIFDELRRAGNT